MRALIVAAVSTVAQADADKDSLPSQLAACRAWCALRSHPIVGEITIPGHSRNYDWMDEIVRDSPEYAAIVDHIRARAMDLIVVRDMDRLWRTDALRAQLMALCRQHRVQVYSLNQPVEPADPERLERASDSSLIIEALSGIMSEQENRTRARRMLVGRKARVERHGLASYGPNNMPYGYRASDTPGVPEPDPLTAHYVRQMFAWRADERLGYAAIARRLNDAQVPTPHGASLWQNTSVHRVLTNAFYAGRVRYGSASGDGQHAPLIDADTWQRVAALNGIRASWTTHNARAPEGGSLLRGLVRCGYCGYAMSYQYGRSGAPSLVCSHYRHTGGSACQSNYNPARPVEAFVLAAVTDRLRNPVAWADARADATANGDATELTQLADALADLDRRHAQWSHAYETGAITLDELLVHRERIAGQRVLLSGKRDALANRAALDAARRDAALELTAIVDTLPELPPDRLRRVYHRLIDHIAVRQGDPPAIVWL